MKKEKMSLENIRGKMNRMEMRNIMAGSGSCQCGSSCVVNIGGVSLGGTCSSIGSLCWCRIN